MNLAKNYARALFALIEEKPSQGVSYLRNLDLVLKRKGNGKLLPRIFAEYNKLSLQKERAAARSRATPQGERTRVLLELYRKLLNA